MPADRQLNDAAMHIVITGANGFVGGALARRLIRDGRLGDRAIAKLTLVDLDLGLREVPEFVYLAPGDLSNPTWLRKTLEEHVDVLFHLASVPGGTAEKNYELARKVNLDATMTLLELGKAQVDAGELRPIFVFASTVGVFGEMPSLVTDESYPRPLMTYGAQKLAGEVLVADFSRRGWMDGRSLRISGVLARPPAPTGQLSAFMSDIIRELAGGRPFVCPTTPNATIWATSLPCVVDNLILAGRVAARRLAGRCTLTLPALRVSMGELVDAIASVYKTPARSLVRFEPNELVEALFGRQPPLLTEAAEAAGFGHDGSVMELVRRALSQPSD